MRHFPQKRLYLFLLSDASFPQKCHALPLNLFFEVNLENIVLVQKIVKSKNIQNLISYKKGYIDFCRQMPPSLKMVMSPHK